MLSQYLTQRFGPLKDLEIVRTKACAFVEFTTVEAARRAIAISLPQSQGGEGGIWLDAPSESGPQVRITVETKKERNERPPSRPRGGAPGSDGAQRGGANVGGGNFRGRGGGGPGRGGRGGVGVGAK